MEKVPERKRTAPRETARLHCDVPIRRRLLLFQSFKQFIYSIVIFIVVLLAIYELNIFHGPYAYTGVIVGVFGAVSIYLWNLFPHKITIYKSMFPDAMDNIRLLLRKFRIIRTNDPKVFIYRENLPEIFTWREASVTVQEFDDKIVLIGPAPALAWLSKKIRRGHPK